MVKITGRVRGREGTEAGIKRRRRKQKMRSRADQIHIQVGFHVDPIIALVFKLWFTEESNMEYK